MKQTKTRANQNIVGLEIGVQNIALFAEFERNHELLRV
jgi:hypothetical protein